MPKVIRDLADTSSYWAAVWAICPMPDVHVICDAPIGCFNLVATAVPDYTDAVPHIENITPSVIREQEVGGAGTGPAVQRTYEGLRDEGLLEGKHLIVVSTAESEMIGSDLSDLVKQLKEGTTFFHSESLSDDEYVGRDRVLQWLWEHYSDDEADIEVEPGLVNIIGPTYGNFNAPSDLHEVKRLIEGTGGRVNMVFPYEAKLSEITNLRRAQVNVVMYQEYGHTLAETLGQPSLYAPMGMTGTTKFIQELGAQLGTEDQAKAFIRQEKQTTLQAVWDLWRGPQSDWFSTITVGIVGTKTYVDGLKTYLGDELGMLITLAAHRPGGMDNEDIRVALHTKAPTFVYGSINERIYLSEAGASRSVFIPAAFPGPIVRRSIGTPFMGYRGCVHLIQEIVNELYDTLFNFLPVDGAYAAQRDGTLGATRSPGNMPWQPEAREVLNNALENVPFISRISVSREFQMKAEQHAREQGASEVTAELAAAALLAPQRQG
jgi:3,8-divinyl chlorophyllide a/chlorophyllide a reductase subunit Z